MLKIKYGGFSANLSSAISLGHLRSIMTHTISIIILELIIYNKNNKYICEGMGKWDTSVNQFFNYEKKLKYDPEYPNNQNKALSNISNKTSSFKDMWKIRIIKSMKYDLHSDISDGFSRSPKR